MLRRGFVDDERTVQMCEDGGLNLSVVPKIYIGLNPYSGNLIPGTGGIRKIRWQGSGRGKRGGIRVIYYVYNESQPIYLLYAYPKNVQVDLTEDEKRVLRDIVEEMKAVFHRKEEQHGADDVRCGK